MTKIEYLLYAVIAAVLLGPGVAADIRRAAGSAFGQSVGPGQPDAALPKLKSGRDPREAFAGTFVTEGSAEVEVSATGPRTRLAAIAVLSRQRHRPPSPLAVRLDRVVRMVAFIAVGVIL
jgi:magnesium-transporting ATPase (P-type)